MLIDSHAHLTLPEFDSDRETVLERARKAGLEHIITVGLGPEDGQKALFLAEQYDFISVSAGIHPHDAGTFNRQTEGWLRELATRRRIKAIGEIGLDFFRNLSPQETQIRAFRQQIRIARDVSLPIVVHDRDAHREVLEILREEKAGEIGGVIHCFSGDQDMARACLDLGFYLSIPGTITFKSARAFQALVRNLPLDRLLIETDCPFLTPHPFRGKRNEPAYVGYVAETIAQIKGMKAEEIGAITAGNTQNLFNLSRKTEKRLT